MTGRKPPGVSWESWAERAIREGMERGEFDGLSGAGRPIDGLDRPHDELWWVNRKLRDEELIALPPTLAVRRDRQQLLANLATFRTEEQLRSVVDELNQRIRHINRYGAAGPPSNTMPLVVEDVVKRWKAQREPATG
ncbi:MAG: DUF1992 domain-containing protein [Ilumatobacteraceae bacterium]